VARERHLGDGRRSTIVELRELVLEHDTPQRTDGLHWIWRSLLASCVGTAVDYALLTTATMVFGVRTVLAAALGTSTGATINFLINRRFAFRTHTTPIGPQAVRYVVAIGLLLCVHALCVAALRDRAGVPLLVAKVGCDLLFLVAGQLLVLRYVVFPPRPAAP
jgi:putative flippase GtrA